MPSGVPHGSRRSVCVRPRNGWSGTASFGSKASIAWTSICVDYRGRTRSMAAANSVAAPERTVVAPQVFDAPRDVVYQAWTDPKQLGQWFPPKDFTSPRCEVDPRPGGIFRCDMKGPDGEVFVGKGLF